MSQTAILTDPSCDAHDWHGHVEVAARLVAVRRALDERRASRVPTEEVGSV